MSKNLHTIVAGVATVQEPDPILATAIAVAEATGATLHFVHAFDLPDPILSAYARDGLLGPEFGSRYRDQLTEQLEQQVRAISTSDRIVIRARAGAASEVLCQAAEELDADLLMVGATRAGKFLRSILGSTAERVVRSANLPVLVLRQPFGGPIERVLLTTDLTEFSAEVHERGLDLIGTMAGEQSPEFRSLLVVWYDLSFPPPLRRDSLEEVAGSELEEFLKARRPRDFEVKGRVRIGDPAKEITAEAIDWQADLLVLGTHSRRRRSRFLLGSVAEATVRATTSNVLILPPVSASNGAGDEDAAQASFTAAV